MVILWSIHVSRQILLRMNETAGEPEWTKWTNTFKGRINEVVRIEHDVTAARAFCGASQFRRNNHHQVTMIKVGEEAAVDAPQSLTSVQYIL